MSVERYQRPIFKGWDSREGREYLASGPMVFAISEQQVLELNRLLPHFHSRRLLTHEVSDRVWELINDLCVLPDLVAGVQMDFKTGEPIDLEQQRTWERECETQLRRRQRPIEWLCLEPITWRPWHSFEHSDQYDHSVSQINWRFTQRLYKFLDQDRDLLSQAVFDVYCDAVDLGREWTWEGQVN